MAPVVEKTVDGYILECLKRRPMSEGEFIQGVGPNNAHLVNQTLNTLEAAGEIERRSGNDWGLASKTGFTE